MIPINTPGLISAVQTGGPEFPVIFFNV